MNKQSKNIITITGTDRIDLIEYALSFYYSNIHRHLRMFVCVKMDVLFYFLNIYLSYSQDMMEEDAIRTHVRINLFIAENFVNKIEKKNIVTIF